jgi:hypothetical protein
LIVPTIDGWIVQWKPTAALLFRVIDLVVAPGETLPTSVPLSSTMWWSVESLLRQTMLLPAAALAGLGVNAALPTEPTIAIVTCDDGPGDGAGAVAGAGDGAGEGDAVVAEGELGDEYPLPHAETISGMKTAATMKRGKDIAGTSWDPDKVASASTGLPRRHGKRRAMLYPRETARYAACAAPYRYRARKPLRSLHHARRSKPVPFTA